MRGDPWLSPALSMTQFKEETMLVHPVVVPGSGTRSWTVLGDDDVPVVPVDRFLAYLTDIGRSPNTVKAYAHDMKDLLAVPRVPGPGLARGPAGGHRRVRRLAAAAAGGAVRGGRGAAIVGAGGQRGDRQPQARRGELVLCAPGPQRRRPGGPAGRVADGRAGRLEAVPAPREQGEAVSRPGDHAEGAEEAAADPHRRRDAGDPGCLHPAAGPLLLRPDARDGLPRR